MHVIQTINVGGVKSDFWGPVTKDLVRGIKYFVPSDKLFQLISGSPPLKNMVLAVKKNQLPTCSLQYNGLGGGPNIL